MAIDGARRWRDERDGGADHRVGPPKRGPFYLGDQPMSYAELLALPREAEALHARLRDAAVRCECGHSVDNETFVIVGDLLRENPIPMDLEAALLRAAALIPGIKLVESERDVAGRPGVGVAVDHAGYRNVLIFNGDSHELLGENERHLGELTGGSAILASGVTDSMTSSTEF